MLDMPVLSTDNETASCAGVDPPYVEGTCDCEQDLYLASLNEIDCDAYNIMYWYHPDYLGSVEFVTDLHGLPYQFFLNTAWGESLETEYRVNFKDFSSRFRFNAKELDEETGNYYYGARYYNPKVSVWLSVDPMAHEYPSLSPYAFVANNPVMLIDPDGRKIVYAKGVSKEFKAAFAKAVKHLNTHDASGMMAKLESSETVCYINETSGGSFYDPNEKSINWDPSQASITDEAAELSPTTILNHEVDHALQDDQNPDQLRKDLATPDAEYDNKEEKRVITGSEQETAKKLGEIKEGEVTRKNHGGSLYETTSPTATEWKNPIIVTPKTDESK